MSSSLATDFGPNDWFVQEKYEEFLADPQSVETIWRDFFAQTTADRPTTSRTAAPESRPPRPRRAVARPGPPQASPAAPAAPLPRPTATPQQTLLTGRPAFPGRSPPRCAAWPPSWSRT